MKKGLIVLAKVLLSVLFLYNIGFFNLDFTKFFNEFRKSEPFNPEGQKKIANFVNGKVRMATKKGEKYSPYDYFNDLYDIETLQKSLKGVISYHVLANELLILHQENLRKNLFSRQDIDKARELYKEKRDPGSLAREQLKLEMAKKNFWPDLLSWLLHFYLKNLPLAFILFLLWRYKEKGTLKISNPFSLLISTLFYPIVIGLVVYEALSEKSRYYLAEAELRRTKKKMFAILSPDEIEDLRRFAKSRGLTMDDWRNYLGNQGLRPQGILVSSLIVTILFLAIPRISFGQEGKKSLLGNIAVEKILTADNQDDQIPADPSLQSSKVGASAPAAAAYFFDWLYEFDWNNIQPTSIKPTAQKVCPQMVIKKIEHIPYLDF